MVDWLHWGGQLVVAGGAGRNLATLREGFLGRYLPADPTGESVPLEQADLQPLADAYPPPWKDPAEGGDPQNLQGYEPGRALNVNTYLPPAPIRPPPGRPVYLTGLAPREGATPLRLGEGSKHLLGAEWRVGRGRVTLLAINLTEPTFANWPGLDTFVRRVVLRRREEVLTADEEGFRPLGGPDLSWVRYLSRDLDAKEPGASDAIEAAKLPQEPVAAWLDSAGFPSACRAALEDASGISIPGRPFVLRVILLYSMCLVPLNWLICPLRPGPPRVGLGRRPPAGAGVRRRRGGAGRPTSRGSTRPATRLTCWRSRGPTPAPTSAGSPRSTRRAGSATQSATPATSTPWPCR